MQNNELHFQNALLFEVLEDVIDFLKQWSSIVNPTTAFAVGVGGSLLGEGVGHHLGVVPTDDLGQVGHGPVTELDRVPIEDTVV